MKQQVETPKARTVLITGGSSGIGAALARKFAKAGDTVWFTYHRGLARAQKLLAEIADSKGGAGRAFCFEQGQWESHQALLQQLGATPDILINNAALGRATVKHQATELHEQEAALLRVNALGPLWLTNAMLPAMRQRNHGKIIHVASVGGGIAPFPGFLVADGMSKAALVYHARQLAAELIHTGIDVFAICPGATDTPMLQESTFEHLDAPTAQRLQARLPKGRLITAEEIADLIYFLCEPAAQALHGAVLDASMGLGSRPGLMTEFGADHADHAF
jgi:NAD(P)-dependent dehydrogenase (short-subunit alcohol dehydrogenase family)